MLLSFAQLGSVLFEFFPKKTILFQTKPCEAVNYQI